MTISGGRTPRAFLTAGNRLPVLVATVIKESTGLPFNFTDWTNPRFSMRKEDQTVSTLSLVTAAFILPRTSGQLVYAWAVTNTDDPGKYLAVFYANDPSGLESSFPNGDTRIEIFILPRI